MFEPVTISMLSSILMAGVWIIYLHIALVQYKRANRPFLIIHHAHDDDPKALCLFVNMSKEPVHVLCVLAYVQGTQGYIRRNITDYDRITPNDQDVKMRLRQGPIQPGGYLILGSFEEIIFGRRSETKKYVDSSKVIPSLQEIKSLEICIAVVHGPSKMHVGARRHFFVEHNKDRYIIRARNIYTEQLVKRNKRKIVRKWIENRVDPKHPGESETQHTVQTERQEKNSERSSAE